MKEVVEEEEEEELQRYYIRIQTAIDLWVPTWLFDFTNLH